MDRLTCTETNADQAEIARDTSKPLGIVFEAEFPYDLVEPLILDSNGAN